MIKTQERVVEAVLAEMALQDVEQGVAHVSHTDLTEAYYESGKLSMVRSVFSDNVSLKVVNAKRKGSVSFNGLDEKSIQEGVAQAIEASHSAEPDEAEGISPMAPVASFCHVTKGFDKSQLILRLAEFVRDAEHQFPLIRFDSITCEHATEYAAYGNTNGVRFASELAHYSVGAVFLAKSGERQSSFDHFQLVLSDLEKPLLSYKTVKDKLVATSKQIEVMTFPEQGKFDLVLTPSCYMEVLEMAQGLYMSDLKLIQGVSVWRDKLNQAVVSPLVTWETHPMSDELVAWEPITSDGYAAQPQVMIEKGVLKSFALSRYGAKRTGGERSASQTSLSLVSNGDESLEDILKPIKRGVLIARLSGGQPSDSGLFSAIAKNSFLIENGRLTSALSETMIATSVVELLENITAVSKETENSGMWQAPYARIKDIQISGAQEN